MDSSFRCEQLSARCITSNTVNIGCKKLASTRCLTLLLSLHVSLNSLAALTQDQLDAAKKERKTLLSERSKTCHTPTSPEYQSLRNVLGAYYSESECLDVEGANLYGTKQSKEEAISITQDEIASKNCDDPDLTKEDALKCVKEKSSLEAKRENQQRDLEDLNSFTGFNFGYGLAFTYTSDDYVDDVDIRNGEVFVGKQRSHRGSFMLETHKFFQPNWLTGTLGSSAGIGPFVAVSLADTDGGDPFSAYVIGPMVGFKDKDGGGSWNIGIGYYVNTEFTELRAGVLDGDSTSETNPNNLTVERDKGGVAVIVSASWD